MANIQKEQLLEECYSALTEGRNMQAMILLNCLKTNKLVQSMSRKGNYWDNAVAESFFKSLKCESIYGNKIISAKEM